MDVRAIIAGNMEALMSHARETGHPELASVNGLSTVANVARPTIDGALAGTRYIRLDILERLASAFGINPWAMLLPDLDPANPPLRPVTETEESLYRRLGEVSRAFEVLQRGKSDTPQTGRADRLGGDRQGTRSGEPDDEDEVLD